MQTTINHLEQGQCQLCHIYWNKNSLATHYRYAYLLQKSTLKLTQLNKVYFCSKCDYNLIQYQILKKFICMERSACHKMFLKRTKCQNFEHFSTWFRDGSGQLWWTLTYQRQFLDVTQSGFAVKMPPILIWSEWNVTPGSYFFLSAQSWAVSSQLCLHETIGYSVSNCFMNIKMKSVIINVETNFRHANHSAAFVSGMLLWFHIPKFHHIPVTCWCLLPSDLVNTSW